MADIEFEVTISGDKDSVDRLRKWPRGETIRAVIDENVLKETFNETPGELTLDLLMAVYKTDLDAAVSKKFVNALGLIDEPIRLTREDLAD